MLPLNTILVRYILVITSIKPDNIELTHFYTIVHLVTCTLSNTNAAENDIQTVQLHRELPTLERWKLPSYPPKWGLILDTK